MESRSPASSQAPRGSHQRPGGAGRASGSPKDITFTTHARDSTPEQGGMKTWLRRQEHSLQGDTH